EVEGGRVLSLAEVARAEELRQADEPGAACGRLADARRRGGEVLGGIGRAAHLDEAEAEASSGHGRAGCRGAGSESTPTRGATTRATSERYRARPRRRARAAPARCRRGCSRPPSDRARGGTPRAYGRADLRSRGVRPVRAHTCASCGRGR